MGDLARSPFLSKGSIEKAERNFFTETSALENQMYHSSASLLQPNCPKSDSRDFDINPQPRPPQTDFARPTN